MGIEEIPQASGTERNKNAAERARQEDGWANELLEKQEAAARAAALQETSILSPEKAAAKAEAENELQALREKVAADKAKRAIVAAQVRALRNIVGETPLEGANAAQTEKAVADLKTAEAELRDLDVATLMSEQKLAAREADYRKDFPETVN